jgi:3-isopropylmalate/(R)-2-methylmalate dehydratase small subunit
LTCEGRVWKFGDDVNTDLIIPGRYLDNYDPDHLAKHAMEGASKEFASAVRAGDVVVAGRNFGCGSSREQAVVALRSAGVSAVVAKSFARIFYRNAVNMALPVLVSRDAVEILEDGEKVTIDFDGCVVVSSIDSRKVPFEPIPERLKEILDCGGLVPYLKSRMATDESHR